MDGVLATEASVMLVLVVSKNPNAKVAHAYVTISKNCKQPLEPLIAAFQTCVAMGDELAGTHDDEL